MNDTRNRIRPSNTYQVVHEGVISKYSCSSIMANCYKGNGEFLNRNNYTGVKLLEHVMKVTERAIAQLIRIWVSLHVITGRSTTGDIV